jgi:hypothetical protein
VSTPRRLAEHSCRIVPSSVLKLHEACRVYTRTELAAGLLDAVGWREDRALEGQRLLEPAAGNGVFLRLAAERLIGSLRRRNRPITMRVLEGAVTGYEIYSEARHEARLAVSEVLLAGGLTTSSASQLAARWVRDGDFLTATDLGTFTHVVGNPPYVRWSKVPEAFRQLYSRSVPEAMQKGDLCVPFFYRSVGHLEPGGTLAFVCSDRWLRAEYGIGLRAYLGSNVRTVAHIEIHDLPAFDRDVHAYAAVTILERRDDSARGSTRTLFAQPTSVAELDRCFRRLAYGSDKSAMLTVEEPLGGRPAIMLRNRTKVQALRKVEAEMPTIEESGCSIRVGAALGYTPAFVVEQCNSTIERALLLPYATSRDVRNGHVCSTRCLIDVFDERGELIDLGRYPGAREYLLQFKARLLRRSCVRRPEQWYRTIDKISHKLAASPKILICGIAKAPRIALVTRVVQPGNSLYSITSLDWPLAAVFNVLSSGVLGLFADAYSCRVNGAFLRFHGVVLKKLRLPMWMSVPGEIQQCLTVPDSRSALLEAVAQLYGTSKALFDEYSAPEISAG